MKPEAYACLKMLESLKKSCVEIHNAKVYGAASGLWSQYHLIEQRLSECLDKGQMKFVPHVDHSSRDELLVELSSAAGVTISFLRSLDSSLEKELEAKEREITRKERELESLRKILSEALDAVKELPEVQRSKAVADWKKYHREIEEHTRRDSSESEE